MIVSKCCKEDVTASCDWYECTHCHRPCDTIFVLSFDMESCNESDNVFETETAIDFA